MGKIMKEGKQYGVGGSQIGFPDYTAMQTIINASGGSYTVVEDGYVIAWGANGANTATKPLLRITVNGNTVMQMSGRDDNYTYTSTPMLPVKKGDVVVLSSGSFSGSNEVHFYPMR